MKKIDSALWSEIKKRLLILIAAIIILFLYVFYNVLNVQFIQGKDYKEAAKRHYRTTVRVQQKRGTIYDRRLKPLAISIPVKSIYVSPSALSDAEGAIAILMHHLNLDYQSIFRKIFGGGRHFSYVKRLISKDLAGQIQAALDEKGIKGVGFEDEIKRYYPHRQLAAQLIGFTGLDAKGLTGVERSFDQKLRFRGGKLDALKDAKRNIISLKNSTGSIKGKYHQVQLTIDAFIQFSVEETLKKWVLKSGSKRGVAIVMIPDTGEILAMSQYPTFDLNEYQNSEPKLWKPLGLSMVYEPGSTFKAISLAAAINEGVVTPHTNFDCENGRIKIGRFFIRDSKPHGLMDLSDILMVSSNIGTLKALERLNTDTYYNYIKSFGFGSRYKIALPGQERGLVQPKKRWKRVERANISFGQGIGVTPLQLITAFSAVINGGKLMSPSLVKGLLDQKGKVTKIIQPKILKNIISPGTSAKMRKMLQRVVSRKGTAPRAAIKGISIGGKTGTAQKVDPALRRYSDKRIASFIGFFPVEEPKFTILVIMDEPTLSNYGGVVAAPPFREMTLKILKYYHLLPENFNENDIDDIVKLPNFRHRLKLLNGIKPDKTDNMPPLGERMPDLMGLSLTSAVQKLKNKGKLKVIGSGIIEQTDPAPGALLIEGEEIKIFLQEQY